MNSVIYTAYHKTPIGHIKITFSAQGLRELTLVQKPEKSATQNIELARIYIAQLDEYFSGQRKYFDVKLDLHHLPLFHQDVLKMISSIPYGKTRSYKQLASVLGKPKASRAVGRASHNNPIPIIIPCHRVIGNDGKLTGYAYGLDMKRELLEMENPDAYKHQMALFEVLV